MLYFQTVAEPPGGHFHLQANAFWMAQEGHAGEGEMTAQQDFQGLGQLDRYPK